MPEVSCPFTGCQYSTGDVIPTLALELLKIHGLSHASQQNTAAAKVEKVTRPSINTGVSPADWKYFETRWSDYVEATSITGKTLIIQLLECCDEQLRRDLTRNTVGSLTSKTSDEILTSIKKLAVREENPMVARAELHSMIQGHDEPVRGYCARVRGQAAVCKYTIECPDCAHIVDYTDHVIRDVVSQGLADKDIQLDLLGNSNQTPTLEETLQFIEKKESGKRSASRLSQTTQAAAASSSYRKHKYEKLKSTERPKSNPQSDTDEICTYCGKTGHGRKAPPRIRRPACSAFGHTCEKCNVRNHFASKCRGGRRPENTRTSEATDGAENTVYNELCIIQEHPSATTSYSVSLDHHVHNNLTDTWLKRPSMPQPTITLSVSINKEDYESIGVDNNVHNKSSKIDCIADTGCQSCLGGIHILTLLGLSKKDLIPVTMSMRAANSNSISITGAIVIRLTGHNDKKRTTRQMVYITESTNKLFLSR